MIIPAKTIQIFLPDGNPRGLKIAEITSRTVQAILIPRSLLKYAFSRSELNNVGIYLLIGDLAEDGKALVYVGEAEDCLTRLRQQNQAKDFWSVALVIVSKTRYFTKTHVKYLEWYCYTEANKVQRYSLENSSTPTKPFISESMEADLLDNFETIKILVSTLGYPIFDEIKKPKKKNTLVCKGKNAIAEGDYTEDGLIVFAGSEANVEETRSIPLSWASLQNAWNHFSHVSRGNRRVIGAIFHHLNSRVSSHSFASRSQSSGNGKSIGLGRDGGNSNKARAVSRSSRPARISLASKVR